MEHLEWLFSVAPILQTHFRKWRCHMDERSIVHVMFEYFDRCNRHAECVTMPHRSNRGVESHNHRSDGTGCRVHWAQSCSRSFHQLTCDRSSRGDWSLRRRQIYSQVKVENRIDQRSNRRGTHPYTGSRAMPWTPAVPLTRTRCGKSRWFNRTTVIWFSTVEVM